MFRAHRHATPRVTHQRALATSENRPGDPAGRAESNCEKEFRRQSCRRSVRGAEENATPARAPLSRPGSVRHSAGGRGPDRDHGGARTGISFTVQGGRYFIYRPGWNGFEP